MAFLEREVLCDVCDRIIVGGKRQVTCGVECSKIKDRAHNDLEKARELYREEAARDSVIDRFLYGKTATEEVP